MRKEVSYHQFTLHIIISGGKLLLAFKQDNPADHVDNEDVLKALGLLEGEAKEGQSDGATGEQEGATGGDKTGKIVCEEDVCKRE